MGNSRTPRKPYYFQVPNLPRPLYDALRARCDKAGTSMWQEVVAALTDRLMGPTVTTPVLKDRRARPLTDFDDEVWVEPYRKQDGRWYWRNPETGVTVCLEHVAIVDVRCT